MTDYADASFNAEWGLLRARGLLLDGMGGFLALVEADATARRAVIAYDVKSGIEAWDEFYVIGRDACLAIESRLAAEEALR